MAKNNTIAAVFILHVVHLPNPWLEDGPHYYFRSGTVTRHPPEIFLPAASATRITHLNFTESVAFFGLSTTLQVPSGSAGTVFLCYPVSLPNMVIRWASSGSTGTVYVDTLYGFTTPCYTIHCS